MPTLHWLLTAATVVFLLGISVFVEGLTNYVTHGRMTRRVVAIAGLLLLVAAVQCVYVCQLIFFP